MSFKAKVSIDSNGVKEERSVLFIQTLLLGRTKNNIDKQLRFLERSASQGNVTAQFNYGVFLSDTNPTLSEYYNLNRAIYWMEFAVNNGNIDTKSKLQELKKLKRMDRRKNKENP